MDKLSGLVLDAADDPSGEILKALYPTLGDVPESIKSAAAVDASRRDALPDDVCALVLSQGGTTLKKFACIDEGNTKLSVDYFLRTHNKLPEEAQKVAAANLCEACTWYGLEPPEELQKIAMGAGTLLQLGLAGPTAIKSTGAGIKQNMQLARQSGSLINPAILGGK